MELEIQPVLAEKLERYENLTFLEHYAMYMGKAQLLEMGLKRLLIEKFEYEFDAIEKWTLGRVKSELREIGLRPDFIALLESVVEARNYIAHDLLADQGLMQSILNDRYYSKFERILSTAIIELEQIIIIFDWTNEHNGWE